MYGIHVQHSCAYVLAAALQGAPLHMDHGASQAGQGIGGLLGLMCLGALQRPRQLPRQGHVAGGRAGCAQDGLSVCTPPCQDALIRCALAALPCRRAGLHARRWRLREVNELPHYLSHRLNASHTAAVHYVAQFPSHTVASLARFVCFVT